MFLKQIDISGFREIQQLSLQLDQTTVLIGENNMGKSTILEALQLALDSTATRNKIKFTERDHYLPKNAKHANDGDLIKIVLHFVEQDDKWSDDIALPMGNVIQPDDNKKQNIIFCVESKYNASTNETTPEWSFLGLDMKKLSMPILPYKNSLQKLVPIFPLKTIRDAKQEFQYNSPLWGSFVRSTTMSSNTRQQLEDKIDELNQNIIDAHGSFNVVKKYLEEISKLVMLANSDIVTIEALSGSVHDILSRTRMYMTSVTGANIPIEQHGEGTRSLTIICLFIAFLNSNLYKEYSNTATPILTIEEPEAHLHPSAAHSVIGLLDNPVGQNIIATHSGDLVSNVKLSSLRHLARRNGKILIHQIDQTKFTSKDLCTLEHHIKTTRGNILFARCWLFVEGKVDRMAIEQCADACGINLIQHGVYCIEYVHISNPQILIRFAKQLGIEYLIVADGDDAGTSYIKKAKKEIDNKDAESHIYKLDNTLDVLFCLEGYGHHYQNTSAESSDHNTKDVNYWKDLIYKMNSRNKTPAAIASIEEMYSAGKEHFPKQIHHIIEKSIQLAKGE
ncbi:MAG: DUF2813 domain-containing protein [Thaumarchaeota archaeon]|nr:DUF2813 domain-containing protein [Nitrososphaerota archaeon]